jgi:hypothetical protein
MVRCAGTLVETAPTIHEAPGWRRLLRRCRRSATEPRRPWQWSGAVPLLAGGECLVGGGEKVGDGCGTDLHVEGAESCECLGCVGGGPRVRLVCGVGQRCAGHEGPPWCDGVAGTAGVAGEVGEYVVAGASAPGEKEPWVVVEAVGEHVEHGSDVLARVLPVGARAGGMEVVP